MMRIAGSVKDSSTGKPVGDCRVEAVYEYRVTPEDAPAPTMKSSRSSSATATVPKSYVTSGRSVAVAGDDGRFAMEIPNAGDIESKRIQITVASPSGERIGEKEVPSDELDKDIEVAVTSPVVIVVDPPKAAAPTGHRIIGRVFDVAGRQIPSGLQVVVYETGRRCRPHLGQVAVFASRGRAVRRAEGLQGRLAGGGALEQSVAPVLA